MTWLPLLKLNSGVDYVTQLAAYHETLCIMSHGHVENPQCSCFSGNTQVYFAGDCRTFLQEKDGEENGVSIRSSSNKHTLSAHWEKRHCDTKTIWLAFHIVGEPLISSGNEWVSWSNSHNPAIHSSYLARRCSETDTFNGTLQSSNRPWWPVLSCTNGNSDWIYCRTTGYVIVTFCSVLTSKQSGVKLLAMYMPHYEHRAV